MIFFIDSLYIFHILLKVFLLHFSSMSEAAKTPEIESILAYAIKIKASDIHLSEGDYIGFRVHGEIGKMSQGGEQSKVSKEMMHNLTLELLMGDQKKFDDFLVKHDMDFAYVSADGTPFRVNGFFKLGRIGFVLRRIEREAKKMEDL